MKQNNRSVSQKIRRSSIIIYLVSIALIVVLEMAVTLSFPESRFAVTASAGAVIIGIAVLITAMMILKSKVKSALRKEELEQLVQHLNSMAILWDTSYRYIRVNDEFIRRTGYTAEDLLDPEILKLVLPSDAFSQNLQSIINNRDETFNIRTKNGGTVCTVWNTSPVLSEAVGTGTECILMSIGPDLTEKQKMRQEIASYSDKLKISEKRYALSMELSEIGMLLKASGSSRYYSSPQLSRMLGLDTSDGYIDGDILREKIHPKDRIVFDTFSTALKNDSEKDEVHLVDFRAISADGEYHWYKFRYKSYMPTPTATSPSLGGAVMDITQDKEKDLMIEKMAYVDDVTQIYNRNKIMLIGNEILECVRNNTDIDYWVIVLDIDSFHIINDTCGYVNGNRILAEVAAVISANLTEGGFNARIGGDNFALIIHATDDEELPVRLIKNIQKDIGAICGSGFENQHITCSAGYCLMQDGETFDFAQVLDRAEFAINLSDGSRSAIMRYDNSAHDAVIAGNAIEKELVNAINNNELVLYYQPKINLENGKVIGMEALIRWIKPDGTIVPPSDFIPIAESSMLITRISRFVLHEACTQNKKWQDMGLGPITVSINLTAIDFYQTNVTESIREALEESGLEPQWLDVELTESLALKDIDHAVSQMNEIKELGVKLSMDDFGTGYSSLSYIQILPITILKLDRSFIMYLEEDKISQEIVSAVIRIAKSKKIETIAEGIETSGQAEILKQSGCDHAQGYFFGKPMPAKQFEEFLRSRQTVASKV